MAQNEMKQAAVVSGNTAFSCEVCTGCNHLPCQCPIDAWWLLSEEEFAARPRDFSWKKQEEPKK